MPLLFNEMYDTGAVQRAANYPHSQRHCQPLCKKICLDKDKKIILYCRVINFDQPDQTASFMFENLTEKLNQTFKRLRGHGRLSEQNIEEALKEVRITLLEADVNFKVVKVLSRASRARPWARRF